VQKLVGDGTGALDSTQLGWQNVTVANGLGVIGRGIIEVFAAEPVPESLSIDAAPGPVHVLPA